MLVNVPLPLRCLCILFLYIALCNLWKMHFINAGYIMLNKVTALSSAEEF